MTWSIKAANIVHYEPRATNTQLGRPTQRGRYVDLKLILQFASKARQGDGTGEPLNSDCHVLCGQEAPSPGMVDTGCRLNTGRGAGSIQWSPLQRLSGSMWLWLSWAIPFQTQNRSRQPTIGYCQTLPQAGTIIINSAPKKYLFPLQCLISTGKNDWESDVTSAKGTLAAYLTKVDHKVDLSDDEEVATEKGSKAPGLFSSTKPSRLSLLNGSHTSNSTIEGTESVLVFPDYKLVHVPNSLLGAKEFWEDYLHPSSKERGGNLPVWLLPYECVILLCTCSFTTLLPSKFTHFPAPMTGSHKRRDNRCGIASAVLSHGTFFFFFLSFFQKD